MYNDISREEQKVTSELDSKPGLRQSIIALLSLLICVFPLLEARVQPVEVVSQRAHKPIAESYLSQSDFIVSPASPATGVKHERAWNSSLVSAFSDVELAKLPRQIIQERDRLTSLPVLRLLISIQTSSDR